MTTMTAPSTSPAGAAPAPAAPVLVTLDAGTIEGVLDQLLGHAARLPCVGCFHVMLQRAARVMLVWADPASGDCAALGDHVAGAGEAGDHADEDAGGLLGSGGQRRPRPQEGRWIYQAKPERGV